MPDLTARRKKIQKKRQLSEAISDNKVLELFIQDYKPGEIAQMLGMEELAVHEKLKRASSGVLARSQEYAEYLTAVHIEQLRALNNMALPEALKGSLTHGYFVLKIIKLMQEIAGAMPAKKPDVHINIEQLNQTISRSNPLYTVASELMEEEYERNQEHPDIVIRPDQLNEPYFMDEIDLAAKQLREKFPDLEENEDDSEPTDFDG